jgi:hypothetical protein
MNDAASVNAAGMGLGEAGASLLAGLHHHTQSCVRKRQMIRPLGGGSRERTSEGVLLEVHRVKVMRTQSEKVLSAFFMRQLREQVAPSL